MESAQIAAINFHPGSANYPGIGCYNFALYEKSTEYGITCHHMAPKVDTGDIIMTSNFSISSCETVESLKLKSMNHMLMCFDKILNFISKNIPLPVSAEKWTRKAFTRKQLNELCFIDPFNKNAEDTALRIHATNYPSAVHGAFTTINGSNFYFKIEERKPIV